MNRCDKKCKRCGVDMIQVIESKIYCTPCAVKKNKERTLEKYRSLPKKKYPKTEESAYKKITGKRRDRSCDESGFF